MEKASPTFELPQENLIQHALNREYSSSSDSEEFPYPLPPPQRPPPPPPKKAPPPKRQPKKWLEKPKTKKPKLSKKKVVDLQETSDEEEEDEDSDMGSLEDFIVEEEEEEEEELENMNEIGEEDYPHLPQESQFPPDLPEQPPQPPSSPPQEQQQQEEPPKARPPPKATSVDDFLMLGALKVLSFGETIPYLQGITKKTYNSEMFHAAFEQCKKKWKVTYLKNMQPEYLLLMSVGFVVVDCVHENYVVPSGEKKQKEAKKEAERKAAKKAAKKATEETKD